jgi:hypothetical protein
MTEVESLTLVKPRKNPILEAALAYGRAGLKIYPSPRKDGAAYVKWKEASTSDAATVTQWWTQWPEALICLDCGKSEVGVIDVDTLEGHNVDGTRSLLDLEMNNEFLPPTREAQSPSKGVHYFFRDPGALLKTTSGRLGPGLDTRGRGGMVVLTPSVVKGKGVYRWLNKAKMAPIPQWVLDLVGEPNNAGLVPDAEFEPVYPQEEFKELLNLLNVDDFRGHDTWLSLMLACTHSSTVLDGKEAFMDWTTGNGEGEFAGDWDIINDRWDYNFQQNRNKGGRANKVGTFNKFLTDAGFGDRVQREPEISAADEFGDEPPDAKVDEPATPSTPAIDLERVKRKIKKLLKNTTGAGRTPEEAATFLAKARQLMAENDLTEDDLKKKKKDRPPTTAKLEDFIAYLPEKKYIFVPTRALWPQTTINSILGSDAASDLDRTRHVAVMAWCPGEDLVIKDRILVKGGWIAEPGSNTFNLYIAPPPIKPGNAEDAKPWRDHFYKLFPNEADHVIKWLAHRVRYPGIKINHGLIIGSNEQGIGKDSLLEPIVRILGAWNVKDVSAAQSMDEKFNPHLEGLLCRISEANDLGDDDRYSFYHKRKTWMVAPPSTLMITDKHVAQHPIVNVVGVIISANDKGGLYVERLDRRHHVSWSECKQAEFKPEFFNELYAWYDNGGVENVYAYLMSLDLSGFDPKAPPPKTAAWWEIVNADQSTETSELDDLLDYINEPWSEERPVVMTIPQLIAAAVHSDARGRFNDALAMLQDKRQSKSLHHKLSRAGYEPLPNDGDATDGRWRVAGKRVMIYGRIDVTKKERLDAARKLVNEMFVSDAEQQRRERAARLAKRPSRAGHVA